MRINNAATDGERTLNCSRGFNYNRTVSSVKDVPYQKLPNFDSSLEMNAIQITAMEVSRNNPEQETKADENLLDEPALSPPIKVEPMDHVEDVVKLDVFVCKICGKIFHTKASLRSHHKAVHKEMMFQCGYCVKKFIQQANLQTHIRARHEETEFLVNIAKITSAAKETTIST